MHPLEGGRRVTTPVPTQDYTARSDVPTVRAVKERTLHCMPTVAVCHVPRRTVVLPLLILHVEESSGSNTKFLIATTNI